MRMRRTGISGETRAGKGAGRSPAAAGEVQAMDGTPPGQDEAGARRHPVVLDVLLVLLIVAGIAIVAYPAVSQWWNARQQSGVIADYEAIEQNYGEDVRDKMLEEAKKYNEDLAAGKVDWRKAEGHERYLSILSFEGTPVMCTLKIPKLGLVLPVYHGVDDETLQVAVGHEPGTSVPVGGEDTHAVMTAHRGLPTNELFTNLDRMVIGDIFSVHVLGKDLYYRIYEIDVISPSNVEPLGIQPGRDLCTLVTCTPYGINTHRLLVKGERVDSDAGMGPDATGVAWYLVALALAIPLLVLLALASLVRSWYLSRKGRQERGAAEEGEPEEAREGLPGGEVPMSSPVAVDIAEVLDAGDDGDGPLADIIDGGNRPVG